VASLIHKHVCEYYDIPTCDRPWLHKPQPIVTNEHVKILWDFTIKTDHYVSANRPDIVIYDVSHHSVILLDVAIPADINIASKEQEKISKYQDLKLELQKLWNLQSIRILPIVIGALGSHTLNLIQYLQELPGTHKIGPLLKSTLLGSAHLLRKSVSFPELR